MAEPTGMSRDRVKTPPARMRNALGGFQTQSPTLSPDPAGNGGAGGWTIVLVEDFSQL